MIAWLLGNMAWASLTMLLVLAVRRPAAHMFGAGPAYALWLLPALRLIMPPLPSLAPEVPAETLIVWASDSGAAAPAAGGLVQAGPVPIALWALGAAALLGWQWLVYRRFLAELGRSSRIVGAHRGLVLIESDAVPGPVALGLIDRRIVVSADFRSRYSAEEQRLALDHESVHHCRGDIWWNFAALLILALNWFNPIAWLAFRAFRADQELACDAVVAAAAPAGARHAYARALVKSASRAGLIAACPLNHADQLKRRLKMMKTHRRSRARLVSGAAFILALGGAGIALGSPGFAHPEPAAPDQAQAREERHEARRVIIRTGHDGPEADAHRDHADHRERVMVMHHRSDGEGEAHGGDRTIVVPDCGDGHADEVNEGGDNERTRIVLCSHGDASPAQRAERLAHVRDRIAGDGELSAEQKARVTAAIDREIARLRGQ